MHFYWRVIEELKFLGETWAFKDPSLKRSYERWICRNIDAIAFFDRCETVGRSTVFDHKILLHTLN